MSETTKRTNEPEEESQAPEPMIVVKDVDMVFNIANEQLNSLKEYFIALVRGKLFFREFKALEGINFTVNRGDVYGIVGTNGSGKSTMLKVIAGVLEPSKGTCEINGTIAPLIELGAGFDPELTARENVYLNGALLGYSKKFIDEHFDSIVEFAEVKDFIDMPLKNYSSGMVARIAFAIATATTPDILVVDEALSVGDFMFQEKCERRIDDLVKNHGTTLLFVSHSIDQVERVCEKALWIEKGHMRMSGSVEDVCFAYRNMDYTDFVVANKIVDERPKTVEDLKRTVTVNEVVEALWKCAGSPTSESAPTAREWARSTEVLPADLDAFYNSPATRQDLVDLVHSFALWRKPSASEYAPVDATAFSDSLPVDPSKRTSAEWALSHKLISGITAADGAKTLSLCEPASFIALCKTVTRLYKAVFSYPHDVSPTDWYVLPGYFDYVLERGFMSGYADGTFGPSDPITRGQAVTVVWRCAGSPKPSQPAAFADVKETDFYYEPFSWALGEGLIDPDEAGTYRPEEPIARKDMATLMYRYVQKSTGRAPAKRADLSVFPDVVALSAPVATPMAWAIGNEVLTPSPTEDGKRKLDPEGITTRSAMVKAVAIVQRDILSK